MNALFSLLFLVGLLVLNWFYFQWAITSGDAGGDVAGKVAIGLILGLVTLLSLFAFLHWVSRTLKGELKLEFPNHPYTWGDAINGTMTLTCHRRLPVERISVTLLGKRRIYRSSSCGSGSTSWVPFSETSVDVPCDASLMTGRHTLNFSLQFPEQPQEPPAETILQSPSNDLLLKAVKTVATAGLQTVPRWTLEVRVHTHGADLFESRVLRFNT